MGIITREEKIQKYADELAQQYFPDEANIWARGNTEAMFVSEACVRMAKYVEQELIKKACEWLSEIDFDSDYFRDAEDYFDNDQLVKEFRKVMEECTTDM